jgi:hypothetical protein
MNRLNGGAVNQGYQHLHYGEPLHYREGRHCKKCHAPLSIYNGKDLCNPCWRAKNLKNIDLKYYEMVEENAEMAGAR